jgi:hypothetical protein
VRKHRRRLGDVAAMHQWERRVKRSPVQMAKPDVVAAILLIIQDRAVPELRVKALLMHYADLGIIRLPKASRREMLELSASLMRSDDPDDIALAAGLRRRANLGRRVLERLLA